MKITREYHGELTAAQQQLLGRYFDGELGWFQRYSAERLIRNNIVAGEYLAQLAALRAGVSEVFAMASKPINLWERISARIEHEERNAIFTRKVEGSASKPARSLAATSGLGSGRLAEAWKAFPSLGYGFSAGAVSAALLMLVVFPKASSVGSAGNAPAPFGVIAQQPLSERIINSNGSAETVRYSPFDIQGTDFDLSPAPRGFNGGELGATNREFRSVSTSRPVQPVEIDWVRSDGRLRVMRDAQESNPVIFVAPRLRASSNQNRRPIVMKGLNDDRLSSVGVSRRSTRALATFDDTFSSSSAAGR